MSLNKDWTKLPIHPTIDDIKGKEVHTLSPNLIGKEYENINHYLKTQFNLLREELVRPLVEAIDKLKPLLSQNEIIKTDGHTIDKQIVGKDVFRQEIEKQVGSNVYFDIKLTNPQIKFDFNFGSLLNFTFDYTLLENKDSEDCQCLMTGGMLCLSSDNFENSIVFGIIVKPIDEEEEDSEESKEKLWNFYLKLDIDNNESKNFSKFLLNPKTKYIGVESPSFYEGFRYTLKALQDLSIIQNIPFNEYLVKLPKQVKPPQYITDDTVYDISCIRQLRNLESFTPEMGNRNSLSSVSLLHDVYGNKRTYETMVKQMKEVSTFDTKQFDAFYSALTKELSIIEGPPGTGKTFVGLKIVESLLSNSQVWNKGSEFRPILIVCYKNHALDQFLEGILKFNSNVVRIGGNSESIALENFKLGNLEIQFRKDYQMQNGLRKNDSDNNENINGISDGIKLLDPKLVSKYKKCNKLRSRIRNIQNSFFKDYFKLQKSLKKILDVKELEPYVKPKSLITGYFKSHSFEEWLSEGVDNFSDICKKQLNKRPENWKFDVVLNKKNILEMTSDEKWLFYLYWRQQLFNSFENKVKEIIKTITSELTKYQKKKTEFRHTLCKGAQVIGLTVTGAAKYSELVKMFDPKIMIVEEAAEVLEGHIVAAISPSIEHLILIGDHKQLRPLVSIQKLTNDYKLDISLFERMVSNKLPFIQLELQHRMRPCISQLLKVAVIYDNLRNGEKVSQYPDIEYTSGKNMYFIDHQHIEDNNYSRDVQDRSRSNLHEAKLVVALVKYLLIRNYPEEKITILTTYNAQLALIKKLMLINEDPIFVKESIQTNSNEDISNENFKENKKNPKKELRVRVSSVDGFQGEENNIIIISFVRSSKKNSIGFLGNKNRVNVALSRAKHALYCVGNFSIMANEDSTQMWAKLKTHLIKEKCFGEEFTIGCECVEADISMPGQLEILNLQVRNGLCKCPTHL